jgi:surfeit locus 1 family protein
VRKYAPLVVGIAAALLCARLGVWQLSRLDERRSLNRTIESRLSMPPLHLDWPPPGSTDTLTYRRVTFSGRADYAREIVVVGRSLGGVPGVHVVTPVVTERGAVLVERLWARSPDAATIDLATTREDSSLAIEGVFMPSGLPRPSSQETWPIRVASINPEILAGRFPYTLYGLAVRRTTDAPEGVTLVPLPVLTEGSHMSYAVQWFAFAVIALVGSIVLMVKTTADDGRRTTDDGQKAG